MYKVEFLPAARADLIEIVRYISRDLQNPTAADHLAEDLIEAADSLQDFPYANPVLHPLRPLHCEYRKLPVRNYLLFYTIDESQKLVTVARVIYAGRAYQQMLD